MSGVRIEMNRKGVQQWLRDQRSNEKMNSKLRYEASKIAKGAGKGFRVRTMERRRNRPGVIVYPGTGEAAKKQLEENRLGKAVGGLAK